MYYNLMTLDIKPGKRLASFDYLRKVSTWMTEEKGVRALGYTNFTGPVYQVHLVGLYEGLSHFDRMNAEFLQDEWFQKWFERASKALKWKTLDSQLLNIYRQTEMEVNIQLVAMFSMTLIPGNRFAAIHHLNSLGEHLESTYQVATEVMSNEDGNPYRYHAVLLFDNLDGYDQLQASLREDEWYGQWFQEAAGMMNPATMTVQFARRL